MTEREALISTASARSGTNTPQISTSTGDQSQQIRTASVSAGTNTHTTVPRWYKHTQRRLRSSTREDPS
eukprot:2782892-Rhodomonas_salina.2